MSEVIRFTLRVLLIKKTKNKVTQLYSIHFAFTLRQGDHHISRSDNHKETYCVRIILNKHIREI